MSAEIAARAVAPSRHRSASPFALLAAEWRKVQRTWVLPLIVLGPLGVTLMGIIYLVFEEKRVHEAIASGTPPWEVMMGQLGFVQVMALMLGAALLASMIPDVDHRSSGWKQVFALPVTRPGVYLAKFGLLAGLLTVSSVLCAVGLGGLWVWQDFGAVLPMRELMLAASLPLLGALPVMAFQLLLSTTLANQAIPLVVGVLAPIFGMTGGGLSPAVPFALPIHGEMMAVGIETGIEVGIGTLAGWSVAWAVAFLVAGLVLVSRRDVV